MVVWFGNILGSFLACFYRKYRRIFNFIYDTWKYFIYFGVSFLSTFFSLVLFGFYSASHISLRVQNKVNIYFMSVYFYLEIFLNILYLIKYRYKTIIFFEIVGILLDLFTRDILFFLRECKRQIATIVKYNFCNEINLI